MSKSKEIERERARLYRATEAYRLAQAKYRQSAKGKAAAQKRARRPDVMEQHRQYSRSTAGKESKRQYRMTDKGKAALKRGMAKYLKTEKGKANRRKRDRLRSQNPTRKERQRVAWRKYAKSAKGIVNKMAGNARWRKTPKGREWYVLKDQKRRAILLEVENTLTPAEWKDIKAASKGICFYCHKRVKKITMDHVIPLAKKGSHTALNIVVACQSCNSSKRDKIVTLF